MPARLGPELGPTRLEGNRGDAIVRLKELAVEEKQQQLAKQRANDIIDPIMKVERIKDAELREKAKAAILAGDQSLPPQDEPV